MSISQKILTAFIVAFVAGNVAAQGAPVVDLGYVKYSGYQNATAGINYYRGIRYAEAPIGEWRWRAPRPIELNASYAGQTINASQTGPYCYQGQQISDPPEEAGLVVTGPMSEDCLLLDVYVPMNPVSDYLPVMFQIHGGGYTNGWANTFPGDALVNHSNGNMIYVSIQYRLGMFGFLGGSEIAQNGVRNAGLLDQRAALDWVQRNIRAFGGDPAQVTIIGGSAGGGSVSYMLIAGGAYDQPPFRAAIAEYPWWQPLLNDSSQERQYINVLDLANCTDISCLRSLSSDQLQDVHVKSYTTGYPSPGYSYGVFYYGPVVDGRFVVELPDQAFKHGRFYDVPLIVDHDGYEGVAFSNSSENTQALETTDAQTLFQGAQQSFFSRLYQLYPASDFNSTFFQRQTWFGDFIITCPTYYMATAAVDRNTNSSAVFKMIFTAGSQLHGASIPFLFSITTDWPGANNATIAEILTSYYISFTVTLDPNTLRTPNAPFWPSYISGGAGDASDGDNVGFTALDITYASIVPAFDSDVSPRCDFFAGQGLAVAN